MSLGARATGLDERRAAAGDERLAPDQAARARLERWARLFALGDEDALLHRLAWDGLDRERALRVLSEAAGAAVVGGEAADWTAWVPRFLEEAAGLAVELRRGGPVPELREGGGFAPGEEPPFVELAVPVVRAARGALCERLDPGDGIGDAGGRAGDGAAAGRPTGPAGGVVTACEWQLCREAAGHAELVWHGSFQGGAGGGPGSTSDRADGGQPPSSHTGEVDGRPPASHAGEVDGPDDDGRYRAFIDAMLERGLEAHVAAYPVLARTLARLAETWVEATAELLERWERDREAIVASLFDGEDPGPPVDAEVGLSDRHHDGRRVATLVFASGRRLVYKPRDVGLEVALNGLLAWADDAGLDPCPPALRVLERDGYGWVEHAAAAELDAPADDVAERFFRRAGALLCLAWALRGRDLHAENVIATARGPVLVDPEMLAQPVLEDDAPAGAAAGAGSAGETCLGTGMLTLLQTGPDGEVRDIGGLRGERARGGGVPVRRWSGLRTDRLDHVREPGRGPEVRNRLLAGGAPQRPADFADAIVEGFAAAYRFLVARRDAFLASGGPLDAFRGRPVRFLLRTSGQYGALLYVLAAPRHQRSGVERSLAIDSINRVWAGRRERPALWPLVRDERRALEGLDVPRFTVPSDGGTLRSAAGEEVPCLVGTSGIDAVVERIEGLSEDDLGRQVELLRWSLATSPEERLVPEPPDVTPPAEPPGVTPSPEGAGRAAPAAEGASAPEVTGRAAPGPEPGTRPGTGPVRLLAAAVWIGEVLEARARTMPAGALAWDVPALLRGGDGPLAEVGLYEGVSGPALLFAALARTTGADRWLEACRACLLPRAGELEEVAASVAQVGVADGVCSLAYAATLAGRLAGDPELGSLGARLAGELTEARIDAAAHDDVAAGRAGAVLGMLALHQATGHDRWLELAGRAGDRLLETGVSAGRGTAWPGPGGELRAGFAHGAAGIGRALGFLFARTGAKRYRAAAAAAFCFEEELYSPRAGNWRISDADGRRPGAGPGWMVAWCHGAPGGAMAREPVLGILPEDERAAREREIEAAMETTARSGEEGDDHLCCGRLGRCDALLTVGLRRGETPWIEAAEAIAGDVAAKALDRGRFALPSTPFERRAFLAGFFKGLSGIGYQLARVAAPDRIPSVLAFEIEPETSPDGGTDRGRDAKERGVGDGRGEEGRGDGNETRDRE